MNAQRRQPSTAGSSASAPDLASPPYRIYMLAVLWLIYIFNGVDRSVMWVLLEPIKLELHLTDSELGWLSGFAFGVCYALAAVPIGILADQFDRRRIIAFAVVVWSVMTAACGFTAGFWQLFGARVAVGAAEAGAPPASISFLSDLFPLRSRATVIAIYMSGSSVALVVTYAAGGWIGAHLGWRAGFWVAGVPGLLLAALVWATFKEPPREGARSTEHPTKPSFAATLRYLYSRVAYRWMFLGLMFSAVSGVGISTFLVSFLIRTHHMPLAHAGGVIALSHCFGAACIAMVGRLADALVPRDRRWSMWLPALIVGAGFPIALTVTLSSSLIALYIALALLAAVGASQIGPLYAYLQSNVATNMRATTMSIAYAIQNLIGIGLGALVVGIISDHLKAGFGADSLRYAMAIISLLYFLAALCYLAASSTLGQQPISSSDAAVRSTI